MASKSLQWLALAMLLAAVAIALAADPSREETAANASGYGLKGNYGKNYYNEDSYDSPYPSGGKVRAPWLLRALLGFLSTCFSATKKGWNVSFCDNLKASKGWLGECMCGAERRTGLGGWGALKFKLQVHASQLHFK
jgi:hypothetical protein